ncbi:4'-phosphopantetheinyl transferase superfamily protein [Streptomyces sp. SID8352]|uniref:4'-phosphopantetheinyl transferase family protein n=1 Tax=Streptomyces sp. SID8352 TaxID=2690338 RepID=UPI0031F65AA7
MSRVEVWLTAPVGDQRPQARALLRRAVAEVLGVSAAAVLVGREPGGRPWAAAPGGSRARPAPAVHVSVSHTRGLTAVAVSTGGEVGVDVEAVRGLPALGIARRWFSDGEVRWIEEHAPAARPRALLWVWTHKEALGKVTGNGLSRGGLLRPVPLPASGVPDRGAEHPVLRETAPGAGLTSAAPAVPAGHLLCVAGGSGTGGLPVSVRRVDG